VTTGFGSDTFQQSELGLPQVFSPAGAAKVLRDLGLSEMTECALRTRAYRKQVPFHLNGRRIIFTLGDLKEIAEGEACRPQPRNERTASRTSPRPARHHRTAHRSRETPADAWRAHRPRGLSASTDCRRS
jgi:hypothetical protein